MTTMVHTVTESATTDEIATLMTDRGVSVVPVVRGQRVVGILGRIDLVRAMIEDAGTDVLWVGLGSPKQELWIAEEAASAVEGGTLSTRSSAPTPATSGITSRASNPTTGPSSPAR